MLSNLRLIYLQQNTHGGNSGLEKVLLSTASVINNQEMGVFSDFFLSRQGYLLASGESYKNCGFWMKSL